MDRYLSDPIISKEDEWHMQIQNYKASYIIIPLVTKTIIKKILLQWHFPVLWELVLNWFKNHVISNFIQINIAVKIWMETLVDEDM